MPLSIAIVGFPNVGKSTLFNALLKKQAAEAANYPFATIEPNVGVVPVPDARLDVIAKVIADNRTADSILDPGELPPTKPATVEFVDVAGLVRGAHKGEGLGNKFLSHIRETSAIAHVLRAFTDDSILREGTSAPAEDLQGIRLELQLADLETLGKQKQPHSSQGKEDLERWDIIEQFRETLEAEQMLSSMQMNEDQAMVAKELGLLTSKPELFVVNVDEDELSRYHELREEYAKRLETDKEAVIIVSAQIESELAALDHEDQIAYLTDLGLEESGLERLAQAGYETLGLQSFITAGEKEVRAWTIEQGTTARQAAGVIHSDFAKNFIKAKVTDYTDFVEQGGWKGVREQGMMRQEGADYIMQPDDVVEFAVGR